MVADDSGSSLQVIPIEQWSEDAGAMHWNEKERGKLLWVRLAAAVPKTAFSLTRRLMRSQRGRNTGGYYTNSVSVVLTGSTRRSY